MKTGRRESNGLNTGQRRGGAIGLERSKPQDLALPNPWTADPYVDPMVTTDDIELVTAYRRGNGLCGICGLAIDLTVRSGPAQPTIDHILARSRGGGDERTNLQAAHRGCNSRKGCR